MRSSKPPAELEAQILAELAEIEQKIGDLVTERTALQRMLTRVRQKNLGNKDVTRRNSYDRILVEDQILDALKDAAGSPLTVRELYARAKATIYQLKDSTFRSHLHRMKQRGLVKPSNIRGRWLIAPPTEIGL